ncbi:hypothetical protein ABIF67_010622 [Bradyrhizobium japonicum]
MPRGAARRLARYHHSRLGQALASHQSGETRQNSPKPGRFASKSRPTTPGGVNSRANRGGRPPGVSFGDFFGSAEILGSGVIFDDFEKNGKFMRGTGQTKAMVEKLPETGSVVVVHTDPLRSYVRDMILTLRGSEVLGRTRIEVIKNRAAADRLVGLRVPVFVDHAFADHVSHETASAVRALADGTNSMFRKAG